MGTFKSSRDSQLAYSTDNHHPHIHFDSFFKDLFEIRSRDFYNLSPVWLKRMAKHFEFNLISARQRSWLLCVPLPVIVLGYSLLVGHCKTDKDK